MTEEIDWDLELGRAREEIRNHPNFAAWRESLPEHTRRILDDLLDHNVTEAMIVAADESPDEEWDRYTFLRALGNGTTAPHLANDLTDVVLGVIPWDMLHFPLE